MDKNLVNRTLHEINIDKNKWIEIFPGFAIKNTNKLNKILNSYKLHELWTKDLNDEDTLIALEALRIQLSHCISAKVIPLFYINDYVDFCNKLFDRLGNKFKKETDKLRKKLAILVRQNSQRSN